MSRNTFALHSYHDDDDDDDDDDDYNYVNDNNYYLLHYYYTYLLTPWSRVLLVKLTIKLCS
jgi:hypothetical protein